MSFVVHVPGFGFLKKPHPAAANNIEFCSSVQEAQVFSTLEDASRCLAAKEASFYRVELKLLQKVDIEYKKNP